MKTFIVKANGKTYRVKTNDFRSAVNAVKAVTAKDEASQLDVIKALVTDEQAAIAAYANAIANLDGKVDPQYVEVLRNILKEENKHVENLQAIITGNVTKKNVEDSVKDDENDIKRDGAALLERAISALKTGNYQIAADNCQNFINVLKMNKLAR